MIRERIGPMHGDQPAAKPMPDQERGEERAVRAAELEPLVHHQRRDLEHADHVQSEHDHDDAADARDPVLVVDEDGAERAGGEPDRHEDDGEAGDERQRVEHRARAAGRVRLRLELLQARTGEEGEIGGDQRQHAGRDERDSPARNAVRMLTLAFTSVRSLRRPGDPAWRRRGACPPRRSILLPRPRQRLRTAARRIHRHVSHWFAYPNIDPIAFSRPRARSRPSHWYGLSYLFGFICVFLWMNRPAGRRRLGLTSDQIQDFLVYALVGVLVGGRIGFVIADVITGTIWASTSRTR